MPVDELSINSPMGVIMESLPGARRALFSRYHLGGCQSCGFSPQETLAELCSRAGGHDADEALRHLLDSHQHDEEMLVSPLELKEMLSRENPPLLLDTRTREEHEAVAITGSDFMTQERQTEIFAGDPEREIILYDHSGKHVLDTCSWFQGHGLKQTRGLRGGIDAYSLEVEPTLQRYRLEID